MLKNFFKIAFRNLVRHKSFSFINIAGLTLGITACLLIGLFVWDERQYDRFITGGNSVYRVYMDVTRTEERYNMAGTPPMFATSMKQQYPEVDKAVRILQIQSRELFEAGNKKIYEEGGIATEPGFFDLFTLPFKYGRPAGALDHTNSIIITQDMARKYFGDADPVGKRISMNKGSLVVRGVIDLRSVKFHLPIQYIIPMAAIGLPPERMKSWTWQQFYTYVKLKNGANAGALQAKFQQYVKQNVRDIAKERGLDYLPLLQPLRDIHLYSSSFKFDMIVKGNITYVKALTVIAIFILLIACFNFVNLATAKSLQRAKEVGVRKSIGASRAQLMMQFTGETMVLSLISIIISAVLAFLFLPALNRFTEKEISGGIFLAPAFLLMLLATGLVTGVLAGFYPALVLSRFQPVKVLKGTAGGNVQQGKIPWLRHGLVVVQFALSALLIVSAIIVYKQVDYLHNKELGFNKEQIMFFPMRGNNMSDHYASFKNDLIQSPGVLSASIGYGFPGDMVAGDEIIVPHKDGPKEHPVTQLLVDHDYVRTLGLQIVAGRDFSKDIKTDETEAFIINETAVRELGYGTPEKALGQRLMWKVWVSNKPDSLKQGRIIGVVKDFHYKSLYDKLTSAVLQIYPPAYWKVAVKVRSAGIANTVSFVKNVWNRYSPDFPIEYKFLDESFGQMYKMEDKLKTLLSIFTALAIFIGCMGLFGLAAYSAERRTKEIGIRKVLGASVNGLVLLLSKDFIKLVLIALLIASPAAWYFMSGWLQDFAYRIDISWWMFALAAALAIIIALAAVSSQAIRAATANPIRSLRME